jgi:hypothetical protein
MGFGLVIGFIELNCGANANSHTLQFTTACTKFSQSAYIHQLSLGNGFQRRSFLCYFIPVLTGQQLSHN